MKEGELVESGTHEYLKKHGKEYIRLNQIVETQTHEHEKESEKENDEQ